MFFISYRYGDDEAICNCGEGNEKESFKYYDEKWCCTNSTCSIDRRRFDGNAQEVSCKGRVLKLQEPCENHIEGKRCNFYQNDEYRNYKAERSFKDACNDQRYFLLI